MNKRQGKKMSMKKRIGIVIASVIGVVVIGAGAYWFSMPKEMRNMLVFMVAGGESYESYEEYQVIDRNDEALAPTAFDPVAADPSEGDDNWNIAVVTEMLKNEDSGMLKQANVQRIGIEDYTGWNFLADEGAAEGEYPFGPSPLSYYTTGIAANLHTQVIDAAAVLGVELEDVTVEVLNFFRWDDMMAPDGTGHLDSTKTNIIIESDASEDLIQEVVDLAINGWAAGEALRNETVIEPALVINGENWDTYRSVPGTSSSEVSYVDDLKISSVSDVPVTPEYLEFAITEDEGMSLSADAMSNMTFEIFAISESAATSERPYLKKVTLSTPSEETWEIYADEFMGADDTPVAPTSLEYFTAGTALCLTSQTTLVSMMMGLDCTEYRVENQTDYRQEDVGTTEMAGYADTVHSYILVESDESQERLEEFYAKSLSLCFAGEGLKNATDMETHVYLNDERID